MDGGLDFAPWRKDQCGKATEKIKCVVRKRKRMFSRVRSRPKIPSRDLNRAMIPFLGGLGPGCPIGACSKPSSILTLLASTFSVPTF